MDFLNLAEILNFGRVFVLPYLRLSNLNFARNHIDHVEHILFARKVNFDACIGFRISQIIPTMLVRGEADGIDGTDLKKEVALRPHQIKVIVSVEDLW